MKVTRPFIAALIFIFLSCHASAATRYWVSILGGNWNSTGSWATSSGGLNGASVPVAGDAVIFDGGSILGIRVGKCTINTTVNVASIEIDAKYTGTIIQGANPITITGAAALGGGTFTGGTANITVGGNFTLSKTAFTSTSATLELDGNAAFTGGPFTHNNGLVKFNGTGSQTLSGTSPVFYNLEFVGTGHSYTLSSTGDIDVVSNLAMSGASSCTLNSGQLDVSGNIILTNTSTGDGGTSTIDIDGSGNQAFTSTLAINQSTLPAVTIDKAGGTLTLPSMLTVMGNWTYTAGTLDAATNSSTVAFDGTLTITGSHTLNNILFEGANDWTFTIASGTVLTANANMAITGGSNVVLNTGTINLNGDLNLTNTGTGGGGSAVVVFTGSGNQAANSSVAAGQDLLPFITIQKPSGTLTLGGTLSESRDWTYVSGAVVPSSSTVVFGGNNISITSAGMSFNNVRFSSATSTLVGSLSVNNDLGISGTGILSPGSNTINLGGNWTDRGSAGFTEAGSTVNFSGSTLQSITVPGGENFASMILNNVSGIRLDNAVAAASGLTMTQGNIDLNGNSVALGSSAAVPGTLNYTTGTMINTGSFIRWFGTGTVAAGSAAGLFPVGTANEYRPLFISAPVSGPTVGGTIAVSYTDASTNSAVSIADPPFTVSLRKDLNWAMSAAGIAGGSYDVQVQGKDFGKIGLVSDLRLTQVNGVVGTEGANGGTTTNPQVNRTALTAANLSNAFYLGSINSVNTSLPITLLSFTAMPENNRVLLNWETSAEVNNNYFTLLRSPDAVHWQQLLEIPGSGNTNTDSKYAAVDPEPYSGISYYRLSQMDMDGEESLSMIKAVRMDVAVTVKIYPNPTTGLVYLEDAAKMRMSLFNGSGQQMKVPVVEDGSSVVLNLGRLPEGIYFLQLWDKGRAVFKTIIKE